MAVDVVEHKINMNAWTFRRRLSNVNAEVTEGKIFLTRMCPVKDL